MSVQLPAVSGADLGRVLAALGDREAQARDIGLTEEADALHDLSGRIIAVTAARYAYRTDARPPADPPTDT